MQNADQLLKQIKDNVKQLNLSYNRTYLLYHNYDHTQRVVAYTSQLASHYELDDRLRFIILTAAWFHDTGQLTGDMAVHEETSVQFMKEFLRDKEIDLTTLNEIAACIMATKMPVNPVSLLEKIICDADTWHLGTKDFLRFDPLVWQELELRLQTRLDNQAVKSLQFLKAHRFYTDHCMEILAAGKEENISILEKEIPQ